MNGERREIYTQVLLENLKRLFGRPRRRCEGSIRGDLNYGERKLIGFI
jgi:hypothetical protein